MNTYRSSFRAHSDLSARAQAQLIEQAEWMRILRARDAKKAARAAESNRRAARRFAPRNAHLQSGAVSYVVSVAAAIVSAVAMVFGRFI